MTEQTNYPYWRVILGFTLCPAGMALLIVCAMFLFSLFTGQAFSDGWEVFGGFFAIAFIAALTALYLFGVPAFLLSLLYAWIKLRKSWWAYLLTFFAGGCGAQAWALLPVAGSEAGLFEFPGAFILGAISSLIMAFIALPSRLEGSSATG